jgi:hypothetical protein
MVLEGLRGLAVGDSPARGSQYVRAMGAGGAGGKGLARVENCMTCLDVGEYEALARERSRLALRALTMRSSVMRRDAQAAIDMVVAEGAARALAANASAKAKIAGLRGLSNAQRLGYIGQLAASSARILNSSREDWLGQGSGGYARTGIAGLAGWVPGTTPDVAWQYEGTPPAGDAERMAQLEKAMLDWAAINSVGKVSATDSTKIQSRTITDFDLPLADKRIWDAQVSGWTVGPWYSGGSPPYTSQAAAVKNGTLPFKVSSTLEWRYNGPARTLKVSINNPAWLAKVIDWAVDQVESVVGDLKCAAGRFVINKTAAAALSAAQCGDNAQTADCNAIRAARDESLKAIGCGPSGPALLEFTPMGVVVEGRATPPPAADSGSGTAIAAVGAGALLLMLLAG